MTLHPAIAAGRAAVITGAASGIGLAAARRLASLGMNLVLADVAEDGLETARQEIEAADVRIVTVRTDVSRFEDVEALRARTVEAFGEPALLMNNAGVGGGGGAVENLEGWRRVISTNLFGVVHGVQAFAAGMIAAGTPAAIVNTGSKQGITNPPGDTAYNVSKGGIRLLTEGLQHSLRSRPGCQVSAHLLVPGFTFTGMTRRRTAEKPPGAWTADEVVEFMLGRMAAGDFYIICPDNEVTREIDNARMTWAMQDLTKNRPPLSRWDPEFAPAFAEYLARERGG